MVVHPREYRWSSYCANAEGRKNKLLMPHEQYLKIDRDELARRKSYRALFKAHVDVNIDDEIREATNGNVVLAMIAFKLRSHELWVRELRKGKRVGRRKLLINSGLSPKAIGLRKKYHLERRKNFT